MTATAPLTEDLPLLTRVVEESDLPTLTEVVEETSPAIPPPAETPVAMKDELPVLTDAIAVVPSNTSEVKIDDSAVPPHVLNEAEIQQLVQRLEAQLESAFAQKLGDRLEQLQRLAVDQAVAELKAELPGMLRDALRSADDKR